MNRFQAFDARRGRVLAFWVTLAGFILWDAYRADPVDLRNEPPLIAAGSGQASSGGHCSMTR
jgi:hypothetical protein